MSSNITKQQINDAIALFLIHNQAKIKQLVKPYKFQLDSLLKSTEKVFHDQIKKDYKEVVHHEICLEVTKNLGVPSDSVLELIQELNLEEYLC